MIRHASAYAYAYAYSYAHVYAGSDRLVGYLYLTILVLKHTLAHLSGGFLRFIAGNIA